MLLPILLAATIGVPALHLTEVAGVTTDEAIELSRMLARALDLRLGEAPVIDDAAFLGCSDEEHCLPEIRSRTRSEQVVMLRVLGALTRIRISAARFDGKGEIIAQAKAEVPREGDRGKELTELARALFPEVTTPKPRIAPPIELPLPPPKVSFGALPWVVLAVGVVAGSAGAVLGAGSQSAFNDLEHRDLHTDKERAALTSQGQTLGIGANVLFGVAALAGLGAAGLWVFE